MKFTRFLRSIVALAAAMTLSLAAGAAPAQADRPENPFAGSWSGTWSVVNRTDYFGTWDWTISDAGRLSGRVVHAQDGEGGEIRGHIRTDGCIVFIGFAPSDDAAGHGAGYAFQGTAVIDGDGKLVVSILLNASPHAGDGILATLERN